ncbi:hypothetical protein BLNAU_11364 [Blattamonas nauphoetae]|uniref:Uncharacterized protein n=1 Tax=Blattamonas nauphoetae TaxID=2049346 RepID=A0ABQ9XQL8_9EUKA|nr:hypothetical protein BLNAU_11364 [Blattamonas nauphoetae]
MGYPVRHSTGPLFDFGTLDDQTDQLNVDCVVALSDCTLRNLTTSNQMPIVDRHLRTAQKVVNCQLSSSFGNIWGAISCGLDTPGSFFGINSSFSNIQPSSLLSPPHSPHTNTNSVFESPTRQEPSMDELTLISCRFSQIEGTEALIHLNQPLSSSSQTVTLTHCSFCECGCAEGSPSTLLLCGIESVGLFDVSFVRCGGLNGSSIVVISDSMVDSKSSIHFVDSGSSELSLTDLVNSAELGLIGDTDSPSPSPFLSTVTQTKHSTHSNKLTTLSVEEKYTQFDQFFTLVFTFYDLTDIEIQVELINYEKKAVCLDGNGDGILKLSYQPDGLYDPDKNSEVQLAAEAVGEYVIGFWPPTFRIPRRILPEAIITVTARDESNAKFFTVVFHSDQLRNTNIKVEIDGYGNEDRDIELDANGDCEMTLEFVPVSIYYSTKQMRVIPYEQIIDGACITPVGYRNPVGCGNPVGCERRPVGYFGTL